MTFFILIALNSGHKSNSFILCDLRTDAGDRYVIDNNIILLYIILYYATIL